MSVGVWGLWWWCTECMARGEVIWTCLCWYMDVCAGAAAGGGGGGSVRGVQVVLTLKTCG